MKYRQLYCLSTLLVAAFALDQTAIFNPNAGLHKSLEVLEKFKTELDIVNKFAELYPIRATNMSNPVFPRYEVLELTSESIKFRQDASAVLLKLSKIPTHETWSGSLRKPKTSCIEDGKLSVAAEKSCAKKVHTAIVANVKRAEGVLTKVSAELRKAREALCRLRSRTYHDLPTYCREPPGIVDLHSPRGPIPNLLADMFNKMWNSISRPQDMLISRSRCPYGVVVKEISVRIFGPPLPDDLITKLQEYNKKGSISECERFGGPWHQYCVSIREGDILRELALRIQNDWKPLHEELFGILDLIAELDRTRDRYRIILRAMMAMPEKSGKAEFQKQWSRFLSTIKCMDSAWEIALAGNLSNSAGCVYHDYHTGREYLTYGSMYNVRLQV